MAQKCQSLIFQEKSLFVQIDIKQSKIVYKWTFSILFQKGKIMRKPIYQGKIHLSQIGPKINFLISFLLLV